MRCAALHALCCSSTVPCLPARPPCHLTSFPAWQAVAAAQLVHARPGCCPFPCAFPRLLFIADAVITALQVGHEE